MLNTTCIEKVDQKLNSDTRYIFAELKIAFTPDQQFTLSFVTVILCCSGLHRADNILNIHNMCTFYSIFCTNF